MEATMHYSQDELNNPPRSGPVPPQGSEAPLPFYYRLLLAGFLVIAVPVWAYMVFNSQSCRLGDTGITAGSVVKLAGC